LISNIQDSILTVTTRRKAIRATGFSLKKEWLTFLLEKNNGVVRNTKESILRKARILEEKQTSFYTKKPLNLEENNKRKFNQWLGFAEVAGKYSRFWKVTVLYIGGAVMIAL
jgi:hypothetical protein